MQLKNRETLPVDSHSACLVGRAWIPNSPQGPSPVWIHDGNVYDLAPFSPTVSELLEKEPLVETLQSWSDLELIGSLEELLDNTPHDQRDSSKPWFLAPCDLQAIPRLRGGKLSGFPPARMGVNLRISFWVPQGYLLGFKATIPLEKETSWNPILLQSAQC